MDSLNRTKDDAPNETGSSRRFLGPGPDKVLVADLGELSPPPRDAVISILDKEREHQGVEQVLAVPLGQSLRRHFVAMLDNAIEVGDFTIQTEFWDVFDLIMALGVSNTRLAEVLEYRPEMISRYRNRKNAPPTAVMRRAVLREALKMAKAGPVAPAESSAG